MGVGRSGQVNTGFRKAVTFDVVRRALKDEYILRTWRKWHAEWKVHSEGRGRTYYRACIGKNGGSLERSIQVMGIGEMSRAAVLQTGMWGWPKPGRFGLSPAHQHGFLVAAASL